MKKFKHKLNKCINAYHFVIKNITLFILSIMFVFSITVNVSANIIIMQLEIDNQIIDYEAEEVKILVDNVEIATKEMPPIIMEERTLVPAREVFEYFGANVEWIQDTKEVYVTLDNRQVKLQIKSKDAYVTVDSITTKYELDVPATIINSKTMIPLRFVSESFDYKVDWDNDNRLVLIDTTYNKQEKLENAEENENQEIDEKDENNLNDEKVAQSLFYTDSIDIAKSGFEWENNAKKQKEVLKTSKDINIQRKKYPSTNIVDADIDIYDNYSEITIEADSKITNVEVSEWDNKIILDIENAINDIRDSVIPKENIFTSAVRTSQFTTEDTRVVIDLLESQNYYVELSNDRQTILVTIYKNELSNIKMTEKNDKTTLEITALGKISYESFRMTDDERIVLDILGSTSSIGSKNIKVNNSNNILKLRTSQFENTTTRFVFDTNGQKNYEIEQVKDNVIKITIEDLTYDNMTYYNNEDYYLTINADDISYDVEDIEIDEDYIDGTYMITLPSRFSSQIGSGKLNVEDSRVENIAIYKESNKTVIRINANSPIAIKANKKNKNGNLVLDIVRPGEKYDKVVVLDAGHGGSDPGAIVGKYFEKNYNLDLALKVKEYLEENTDIKVYLTRKDDSYPSLTERADLANIILADMFISIHNNSMSKSTWNGTEVLYNDTVKYFSGKTTVNGLTNKKLARELSDGIIDLLDWKYKNNQTDERDGTNSDDGISLRTDLAVLKLAKMPASLIELAFMTNSSDLKNLNDDDFIEEAGFAIGELIEDIFDDYDL